MTPDQTVLGPAGPLASRTASLWWFAFWIAVAVYVVTLGMLFWSWRRARRRTTSDVAGDSTAAVPAHDARSEQAMTRAVSLSVAATVAILLVFLGYDFSVGRTLSPVPSKRPLTIEVTGYQWWWEATYADTSPQGRFTTANELHVPVGEPVLFLLSAADVIHSFWVPNLAGKKDLIPGYTQSFWFRADSAGVYRGQCAEFCGAQHAKMAMFIVAEPRATYNAWVDAQRSSASVPTDSAAARGRDLFETTTCAMCHNVEGTPAGSHVGPDLTHVGSRRTIAAGSLANTRENMARWIRDAQLIKPGVRMPPNTLAREDIDALVSYMETLK